MEIVSPVILADRHWPSVIDRFWATLSEHFDFGLDTSCGFHVHISPATGSYSISQLRNMAKAVIFWGPATARCAPPSRQDRILDFCQSNIRDVPCFEPLSTYGPLRGLQHAYEYIDGADRDAILDYLCPDKYRAWNFKPSRVGGSGSIEHRRAPGVATTKKAKHWIAFTMAFLDMAAQFSPESLAARVQAAQDLGTVSHPDFQVQLLTCARHLGIYGILDPRLFQSDDPRTLHITTMLPECLALLQEIDPDYHYSVNA